MLKTYYEMHTERMKDVQEKRRQRIKQWFWNLKQQLSCLKCGEEHPAVLVFHHINPDEKHRPISKMVTNAQSITAIKREIRKCLVLCSNCHVKFHWDPQVRPRASGLV